MKDEEVKHEIMMLAKFKPNPNHYIIIDQWNRKEYNKVKFKIFDIIEKEIDKGMLNKLFDVIHHIVNSDCRFAAPKIYCEGFKFFYKRWMLYDVIYCIFHIL
jgi:hypothetical protein